MPLRRMGATLSRAILNAIMDHAERAIANQHGRGVLQGCEITASAGGGTRVDVSAGVLSGVATQAVPAVSEYSLPPDASRYLWMNDVGTMTTSASPDDVGGGFVCLGRVTTNSAAIVEISDENRMMPARQDAAFPWRYVVGRQALTVDQAAGRVGVGTLTPETDLDVAGSTRSRGDHRTDGDADVYGTANLRGRAVTHGHLWQSVRELALTGTLVLTVDDANYQVLDPGGATRDVILPDDLDYQHRFRIAHGGAANSLRVKASDGTLLATLTSGQWAEFIAAPAVGGGGKVPVIGASDS